MQTGQKVTVTPTFHAYRGHMGTITRIDRDDEGVVLFVRLNNGREVMLEPCDEGETSMITWHYTGDGALVLTAVVKDTNPQGNPWGSPFYHSRRYEGFTRREAKAMFRDSLTRDGLRIVCAGCSDGVLPGEH